MTFLSYIRFVLTYYLLISIALVGIYKKLGLSPKYCFIPFYHIIKLACKLNCCTEGIIVAVGYIGLPLVMHQYSIIKTFDNSLDIYTTSVLCLLYLFIVYLCLILLIFKFVATFNLKKLWLWALLIVPIVSLFLISFVPWYRPESTHNAPG